MSYNSGTPCERFAYLSGVPPCKQNELRWCHTDLAANVYHWPRFVEDDMRFGVLEGGHGISHDGVMAQLVVQKGWKVRSRCSEQCMRLSNGLLKVAVNHHH